MSLTLTTFASTIYVNNKTGSDNFTGSSPVFVSYSTGPKLTITSAVSRAVNGDIISIAASDVAYQELSSAGKMLTFTTSDGSVVITTMTIDAQTTLNGPFTIDSGGTLTLSAAVMNASNITIKNGCTIIRNNGTFDVTPIFTGSYRLMYTGSASMSTTSNEWPSTATVTLLTVAMTGGAPLKLHASRTVDNFILNCGTGGGTFDLSNGSACNLTVAGITAITNGILMTTAPGGTLTVQGDVQVSGGSFGNSMLMVFTGSSNQTITVPSGGTTIGNITIRKASGSNRVVIAGGDLTCSGIVTFNNGLMVTDTSNALVLTNAGGAAAGAGLTRFGYVRTVPAGAKSHVVGNVKQNLQYSILISYARNEFPVGDTMNYRPVALTFQNSVGSGNYGIFATVSHTNTRPTGTSGLPIANGIAYDVPLARYPGFFWSIKTDKPMDGTNFNLDLTAAGDTNINLIDVAQNQVKIIRRSGNANDVNNKWTLQGVSASYDNVVSNGIPTVTAVNATGGLSTTGAIFTYGLKTQIECVSCPFFLTLYIGDPPYKTTLKGVFGGNTGQLTYTAKSSDTTIATALIVGDSLLITPITVGHPTISVTATDIDGSAITIFAYVTVALRWTNTVSGTVTYGNTTNPVSGVIVTLNQATGTGLWGKTNTVGNYLIMVVSGKTYQLTATKIGNWGGVTAGDALLVVRHVADIAFLTGLPLLAADVNNSGSITSADALLILRRVVGLDTSFIAGDWVFSGQQVVVANDPVTINVSGLAMGDVNASYTPSTGTAFVKSNATVSLSNDAVQNVASIGTFEIPVRVTSEMILGAVSLKIKYPSDLVKFEGVTSKLKGFVIRADEGSITFVWADLTAKNAMVFKTNEALVTLKFSPKIENGTVGLTLDSWSELNDADGTVITMVKLTTPTIQIGNIPSVFSLSQNYPNPFNPSTSIQFGLPVQAPVTMEIYNILGVKVRTLLQGEVMSAGIHQMEWNGKDDAGASVTSGVYLYRINAGTFQVTKKMMMLK